MTKIKIQIIQRNQHCSALISSVFQPMLQYWSVMNLIQMALQFFVFVNFLWLLVLRKFTENGNFIWYVSFFLFFFFFETSLIQHVFYLIKFQSVFFKIGHILWLLVESCYLTIEVYLRPCYLVSLGKRCFDQANDWHLHCKIHVDACIYIHLQLLNYFKNILDSNYTISNKLSETDVNTKCHIWTFEL